MTAVIAVRKAQVRVWVAAGVIAIGVLVLALEIGGAAPRPALAGVPSPGTFTGWGLPVVRLVGEAAATLATGFLLLAAVLTSSAGNALDPTGRAAVRAASATTGVCVIALVAQGVLTASDFRGVPVANLSGADLLGFVARTPQGWAVGAQVVIAATVVLLGRNERTTSGATRLLLAVLVLVAVPTLTGHAATSQSHLVAGLSLVGHVLAAALWVGGLAALTVFAVRGTPLVPVVARFSGLALWCAVGVAATGTLAATLHLGSVTALVSTGYGQLVLAKVAALATLVTLGWLHRRHTVPLLATARSLFVRLASVELLVMAATYGLAVGLSRSPAPLR
jgi:putative copper export protein